MFGLGQPANVELGFIAQEAAAADPQVQIVVDSPLGICPELGTELTVGQFAQVVESFASRLYGAGVREGDTVAVYKTNNADILAITCALSRIGAVPALLHPQLHGSVAGQLVAQLKPTYVLSDAQHVHADGFVPCVDPATILLASGTATGMRSVGAATETVPLPDLSSPTATRIITHTSGTTGLPKLVAQSAAGLTAHASFQLRVATLLRIREKWALCTSFVHIRTYSALAVGLRRSMPFAFIADHEPGVVRDIFIRFRPGLVETHPNTFVAWEGFAADHAQPLRTVRYFVNTFDAIHLRTIRTLLGASHRRGAMYFQAYGQTESGPVTIRAYTRALAKRAHSRCVGHPIPGLTRVRTSGTPASPQSIEVSTPGRALTYLGQEQRFSDQTDGSWWAMGDVGYRSRWGCLHLLDREVDQIEGLDSILEIEDALMDRLPQLREIVVTRGTIALRQPIICTYGDAELPAEAWQAAIRGLPAMSSPLHCSWQDIPQTATAKVKRIELQALLDRGAIAPINFDTAATTIV